MTDNQDGVGAMSDEFSDFAARCHAYDTSCHHEADNPFTCDMGHFGMNQPCGDNAETFNMLTRTNAE